MGCGLSRQKPKPIIKGILKKPHTHEPNITNS